MVESQPFVPGFAQPAAPQTGQAAPNSDALALLLEQNQQLRTELQSLRAMLEEQGFELRKLQRDSLNRYTNMDNRLGALESAAVAVGSGITTPANPGQASALNSPALVDNGLSSTPLTGSSPGDGLSRTNTLPASGARAGVASTNTAPRSALSTPRTSEPRNSRSRGTLQPAVLSEQQLYQMAYDSVINSNFERSIAEFDQYLSVYPEGRFVTNAHYWKGQAYLYLNRFSEARASYEIILKQYPDAAKLPDAMYGLALAYQGQGNVAEARQLLNEIKRRFRNTGVANLADTRLLTLD